MKDPSTSQTTIPPSLPPSRVVDTPTLELLAGWRQQDATTDPEQIRVAELELAEFKKAMNANRTATGERVLFP